MPDGNPALDQPVELPGVLDILVVGGGPAGTAAAFRAKELDLSALVIDYDDLMKRIRDYAKDKPILPSFGGGDQMQFPVGGEMVSRLQFEPIQKDQMCERWKDLYRRFRIPARVGLELIGLEAGEEDVRRARIWNHSTQTEEYLLAKHVIIAFGRGVPRRFDIPGPVECLAFRLSDPALHLGKPACIIGGGTAAAEAVIAISNAKREARDSTEVYWSYRGDRMPKVSKALADVFFESYVGNGNIRYLPKSEPVSVITGKDQEPYLCIRVDRKVMSDRPEETTQLEFAASHCVACIGEDIPEKLLNSMGVYLTSGGPRNRKRLVVNPLMETSQPQLYLAGDILSPAYLQTDDFDADPQTFPEIKRRGNVKSALRDGVFVAEVIAQKLAGKSQIHVALKFSEAATAAADGELPVSTPAPPGGGPGEDRPSAPRLVRVLRGQITADEFPLTRNQAWTLGKQDCDICFEDDSALLGLHASIRKEGTDYWVRDEGSETGVFVQTTAGKAVSAPPGGILRAGNQWLVFGGKDDPQALTHYDSEGRQVQTIRLSEGTIVLGRESPDITLDSSDPTLSRRHLSVSPRQGRVFFSDLQTTNGTQLKVDVPVRLQHGDRIFLGHQVLEISWESEALPQREVHFQGPPPPTPEVGAPEASAATETPGPTAGPSVTFRDSGETFPLRRGQTICELAEERGLSITAQCHQGICGSDPIRIVSGHQHLNPVGEGKKTLWTKSAPWKPSKTTVSPV